MPVPIAAILGKLADATEGLGAAAGKLAMFVAETGVIGGSGQLLKGEQILTQMIENISVMKQFGLSMGSEYMTPFGNVAYWKKIEEDITNTNRKLNISGDLQNRLKENIIAAGTASMELGITEEDIVNTYQNFVEEYGRNPLLDKENLEIFGKTLVGLGESYSKLYAVNRLYGVSVKDTYKFLNQTIFESSRFGLNAKKVLSDIEKNLSMIDRFSFKRGEAGLAGMVIQANRLGINMESVASFADKVMDPESAIEVAANLQAMGGEFAKLGDFNQLLYESSNDMEAFISRMAQATKGMAFFNKTTDEIDISAKNRRMLKVYADNSFQTLEEVSRQAKMFAAEDIIGAALSPSIKMSDKLDEYLAKLASVANLKTMTVDIGGVNKKLNELTVADIKLIPEQIEGKEGDDLIKSQITATQTLVDVMERMTRLFTRITNDRGEELITAGRLRGEVNTTIEALKTGQMKGITDLINTPKKESADNILNLMRGLREGGFEGGFKVAKENSLPENDPESVQLLKKMLGQYGFLVDGAVTVVGSMAKGVGDAAELMMDAAVGFNNGVKDMRHFFGKGNETEVDRWRRKVDSFDTDMGMFEKVGAWDPFLGYDRQLIQKSRERDFMIDKFLGPGVNGDIKTLDGNRETRDNLIKLLEESTAARREFEYQLKKTTTNEIEIKSGSSSHIIEFAWNGAVYNAYDILEDPKLKNFVGQEIADTLKGRILNGGKNNGK